MLKTPQLAPFTSIKKIHSIKSLRRMELLDETVHCLSGMIFQLNSIQSFIWQIKDIMTKFTDRAYDWVWRSS